MSSKELDQILQMFPYSGYDDQEQRLAAMLLNWAENQSTALEEANVTRNTAQKIRAAWNDLSNQEQARLLDFLSRIATNRLRQQPSSAPQ